MAPRIQYNNQGLISQGPVRLMYPRPVTPLEQARFQKRTGMEYPVLNSWAQQQFGYPLSPVGSTAAPVYQGGLFPAHLQSASNAYRRLQQTMKALRRPRTVLNYTMHWVSGVLRKYPYALGDQRQQELPCQGLRWCRQRRER